ncbi:DNRLRE domain-containing protein [Lysinibacillus sp. NPDC086135]|uniref:DNRLRE domain-containing protein n=1 Tax=Lysinibacillus sp. NPDC086135 TaxID=3364130 RepID=UPI0038031BD9
MGENNSLNNGELLIDVQSFSSSNGTIIDIDNTVDTIIEIKPTNNFKAKYTLIAVGKSEQDVEIIPRAIGENTRKTELISRAIGKSEKDTYLNIVYGDKSQVFAEIQPIGHYNLEAEIEVPPHNKMFAIYEVQQPPIVTDIFNPTQDAFTREQVSYQSINYGTNSSMIVGRSTEDIYRSFVQFDLSSIDKSYVLTESHLRLYYKDTAPTNLKLEILNADSSWSETNITNLNKPNPINLISNEFTINKEKGYIEFDVLDIIKSWIALKIINNGFIIRLSNETEHGQTTFYTRETKLPPELVVKYFDSRIFSTGRSQQLTEIFVYKRRESVKNAEITVDSVFTSRDRVAEIYVHRREVPLYSEQFAEIVVTKPYVWSQIISAIRDESITFAEIGARVSRDDDKTLAEIAVSRPVVLAEITNTIWRDSTQEAIINVTKPSIHVEITVPTHDKNQVDIEIEINETWSSITYAEIRVDKDKIKTEITPRVKDDSSPRTEISVSKPKVEIEVEVKYRNNIWVEIEPNIISDVATEIIVTKPYVEAFVIVQRYDDSEQDTEIFVKYANDVPTEIDAKVVSQVDTIIDIKAVSQVYVEVSVSKVKVNTEITVPTWTGSTTFAEIEPRILMVNEVYTLINIGSKGGAYAFII